ncbi:hypothetical protein, partial [Salmonella enterica]|uniref:hypothetical protein n=1 Tax=Salmonella enterica TaxID=28901 RepID=UPI0027E5957C
RLKNNQNNLFGVRVNIRGQAVFPFTGQKVSLLPVATRLKNNQNNLFGVRVNIRGQAVFPFTGQKVSSLPVATRMKTYRGKTPLN